MHHPRSTFFTALYCCTSVQRLCWSVSGFLSCPSVALDALASRRGGGGADGGGRGLESQAGGLWPGSHLISARPPRLVRDDHNWTRNHDVGLALAGVGGGGGSGWRAD